ncbi:hypothetical protein V8G54_025958 [Vigna mungo]|uniref:Uncharacterized protein n=1 Tax=Vigna mungo TaxID=3915 RepID=A0AAQ3RLN7_VIGMU
MLAPAPLNKDLAPSFFTICWNASKELLYFTASPEVIIILLLTVSIGYDARPAPLVMSHPRAKLAKKLSYNPYKGNCIRLHYIKVSRTFFGCINIKYLMNNFII